MKSHYLDCSLPMQCDCHVFIKKTNGLVKLGSGSGGGGGGTDANDTTVSGFSFDIASL